MTVRWTVSAQSDLQHIHDYIAANNPVAARDLVREFQRSAARLAGWPGIGTPRGRAGERDITVRRNYLLVYKAGADGVTILRVRHVAQDRRR